MSDAKGNYSYVTKGRKRMKEREREREKKKEKTPDQKDVRWRRLMAGGE